MEIQAHQIQMESHFFSKETFEKKETLNAWWGSPAANPNETASKTDIGKHSGLPSKLELMRMVLKKIFWR